MFVASLYLEGLPVVPGDGMELITWGILGFARDHARNLRKTRGK